MSSFTSLLLAALLLGAGVGVLVPAAGLMLAGLLVGAVALLWDDGR